jgi:AcrR family transcriptional regulator
VISKGKRAGKAARTETDDNGNNHGHGDNGNSHGHGHGHGDNGNNHGHGNSNGNGVVAVERGEHSDRLAEIQRSRLIAGAIGAIERHGYAQTTVAHITGRASVSRRTFYELFSSREECLMAMFASLVELIAADVRAAELDDLAWRQRVRGGLGAVLAFFDREPALARVCVVQALRGGPRVLELRERVLAGLAAVVDEGRGEGPRGKEHTPLTAEGLVGAAFAIVYARLLREEPAPLTGLLGELMAMIALPYLGPAAARRELARPAVAPVPVPRARPAHGAEQDPLRNMPIRLTYRTARVLEGVAVYPAASNRRIGEFAGVTDPGQISRLLRRLQRAGLVDNTGAGHAKGEPNAWRLTEWGEQVTHSLHAHASREPEREAA